MQIKMSILVVEDCDALDKHVDCVMKCSNSCSTIRSKEEECAKFVIVATLFKRGRLQKGLLVFVNTIPTSTFKKLH